MRGRGALAGVVMLPTALAGCFDFEQRLDTTSIPLGVPEHACLRAVAGETGEADLTVLARTAYEDRAELIIGVGEASDRWYCIGHADGSVEGIESLQALPPE